MAQKTKAIQKELERAKLQFKRDARKINAAIAEGKTIFLDTFMGKLPLAYVTANWEYVTFKGGWRRTWAGCNDSTWADIKRQAGLIDID